MKCKKCDTEEATLYKGRCYSCTMEIRNRDSPFHSKVSGWSAFLSNVVLPPLFFLMVAVLSLHFARTESISTGLRLNLGVVSVSTAIMAVVVF